MSTAKFARAILPLAAVLAGSVLALRLTEIRQSSALTSEPITRPSDAPLLDYQSRQPQVPFTDAQPHNLLELPRINSGFAGYWGGYVHSSIERIDPDLIGTNPGRVSVIFGLEGDTVFMASELYTAAGQKLIRGPIVKIEDERSAVIEYETEDRYLHYICRHSFRLDNETRMKYRTTIFVYRRDSETLVGIIRQSARLKRLLTTSEQRKFARPSPQQLRRFDIAASKTLGGRHGNSIHPPRALPP